MPGNWKKQHLFKPFSRFQLGKFYHWNMSEYVYVKNLTHYCKTVETGVDSRLLSPLFSILIANTTRCTGPVRIATGFAIKKLKRSASFQKFYIFIPIF